jgi:flagellin-like hook-associated protein FlgL
MNFFDQQIEKIVGWDDFFITFSSSSSQDLAMTDTNAKEKVTSDTKEPTIQEKEVEEVVKVLPQAANKPAAKSKVTDAAFKSTSVALIEKLLQFSTPRLDSKIVNVLFLEGRPLFILYYSIYSSIHRYDGYLYDPCIPVRSQSTKY